MSDATELPSESDHGGSVIALWHNLRRCAILYSVNCDKWTMISGCVEPRRGAELIMSIFDSAVRCPTVSLDSTFFQLHDKTHTSHGVGGAVPLNDSFVKWTGTSTTSISWEFSAPTVVDHRKYIICVNNVLCMEAVKDELHWWMSENSPRHKS